jgi:MFS family permease
LTSASVQLLFGKIYKLYPTKAIVLASTIVFEVGSAICGAAPTSTALIIGRAVAGLGSAGIFAGGLVVMRDIVPLHKRPLYQGLFGAAFGVAGVAAPLLGGAFTSRLTWRWCFYINLPLGAFTILVVALFLKLPKHKNPGLSLKQQFAQLDPLGTLCFIPGTICLLLALQWGGTTYPWNDGRIVALFVLSGVLIIGFITLQITQKEENTTIPPSIIMQRSIAGAVWFIFCTASSMMLFVYYLPLWFQAIQGVDPVNSGVRTLALLLSLTTGSILSGIVTTWLGYYNPTILLCPVIMSIGAGLLTTFTPDVPIGKWVGYQIIYGFGLGLAMQQSGLVVQAVLKRDDVPTGAACTFFFMQLGGAIFLSVGQSVFASALVSNLQGVAGLDAQTVLHVGATDIRRLVPPQYLSAVLEAYNNSVTRPFVVAMAMSCLAILGSLSLEWVSIKKKKQGEQKGPGRETPKEPSASKEV